MIKWPRSNRLVSMHRPMPSCHRSLINPLRRPRNAYGARPQDGAQIHRAWPGAAGVWSAAATGEQGHAVLALSGRTTCGVPVADRAPPASRAARSRLHRRLQHSHRLAARDQADRAAAVRGALRDAARPSGAVDFAHFRTVFTDEPGTERILWLFSLVLGHSRMLWARFVLHQDLPSLLRCQAAAFEALGGVPEHILYDRMRTVFSRRTPRPATSSTIGRCSSLPATTAICRRRATSGVSNYGFIAVNATVLQ